MAINKEVALKFLDKKAKDSGTIYESNPGENVVLLSTAYRAVELASKYNPITLEEFEKQHSPISGVYVIWKVDWADLENGEFVFGVSADLFQVLNEDYLQSFKGEEPDWFVNEDPKNLMVMLIQEYPQNEDFE